LKNAVFGYFRGLFLEKLKIIMIVSLNWLKQYINLDALTPEQVGETLTDLGLEIEGMEHIGGIKGDLAGVVVGHVLTCEKHPDADKLSLTTVDVGTGDPLSIENQGRKDSRGGVARHDLRRR
jgi:tRNA-binding EMAP/Myf-like protein